MTYEQAIIDFKQTRDILIETGDTKWKEHIEQIDMAIDALEKQDKYRWHDINEKMPEECKDILLAVKSNSGVIVYIPTYTKGERLNWKNQYQVIAWKEIEPYEVGK